MADALAAVKRDLGRDAVILHTRNYRSGGILGIGRRTIVDQLVRRVARHQTRLGIERVPARRVAVDYASQPRGHLAEVVVPGQATTSEYGHVAHKLIDLPARPGHRARV